MTSETPEHPGGRRLRSALMLLVLLGCIATVLADQRVERVQLRADHPEVYIVERGDTLWHIAGRFLEQPWQWPDIWRVNPDLDNPHLIYPGDRIRLRWEDGRPQLELERGPDARTVRLTPDRTESLQPRVRETPLTSPIPTLDLDRLGPFLAGNRIVSEASLERAPYVLQGESGRLLTGTGDRLYARGDTLHEVGAYYSVVRRGNRLRDPDTGEVLGLEVKDLGLARVVAREADIGTLMVQRARQDIRAGDRLLPTEERPLQARFQPRAPEQQVSGRLLGVLGGMNHVGQFSVVSINLGAQQDLEPGHVLAIRQQGELVDDPVRSERVRLPSEHAGLLMVFRVFDRVAYGLVLEALRPLAVLDEVHNP